MIKVCSFSCLLFNPQFFKVVAFVIRKRKYWDGPCQNSLARYPCRIIGNKILLTSISHNQTRAWDSCSLIIVIKSGQILSMFNPLFCSLTACYWLLPLFFNYSASSVNYENVRVSQLLTKFFEDSFKFMLFQFFPINNVNWHQIGS